MSAHVAEHCLEPVADASAAAVHVCPLACLVDVIERVRPTHLVSTIGPDSMPATPAELHPGRHLKLTFNDIAQPRDGLVHPSEAHIDALVAFAREWDLAGPLLVHCWAGVSRSTAAAFIILCAHNEPGREREIADALRSASRTATPNALMIAHADRVLGRGGRMIRAIEAIGIGELAMAGQPFSLPVRY